jgi:hypothetical protein
MTTPDIAGLCKRLDILHEWQDSPRDRETITLSKTTLERQAAEIERLRAAQKVLRTSEWEFTGNERASKAFAALTGEDHD